MVCVANDVKDQVVILFISVHVMEQNQGISVQLDRHLFFGLLVNEMDPGLENGKHTGGLQHNPMLASSEVSPLYTIK